MTKIVYEVIKEAKEDPGFDRALSIILFLKWLWILCRHRPTSGQYRPITAQNVYMYVRAR